MWQQVRRKDRGRVGNSVALGPECFDDDLPLVQVTRSHEVANVF